MIMEKTYFLCDAAQCAWKAIPGKKYCSIHAHFETRMPFTITTCKIPANEKSVHDLKVWAEAQKDWVAKKPAKELIVKRAHVGYWCRQCHQVVNLKFQGCRCLKDTENAKTYEAHKLRFWKRCFVELSHV